MRRRRLGPGEYARCQHCGRLTERESLAAGPGGLLYGPDCMVVMVRSQLTSDWAMEASDGVGVGLSRNSRDGTGSGDDRQA